MGADLAGEARINSKLDVGLLMTLMCLGGIAFGAAGQALLLGVIAFTSAWWTVPVVFLTAATASVAFLKSYYERQAHAFLLTELQTRTSEAFNRKMTEWRGRYSAIVIVQQVKTIVVVESFSADAIQIRFRMYTPAAGVGCEVTANRPRIVLGAASDPVVDVPNQVDNLSFRFAVGGDSYADCIRVIRPSIEQWRSIAARGWGRIGIPTIEWTCRTDVDPDTTATCTMKSLISLFAVACSDLTVTPANTPRLGE